jgi:hypothetical protein
MKNMLAEESWVPHALRTHMIVFQIALEGAPPNFVLIYVRLYNDLLGTCDRATKIQTIHSSLVSSSRI